MGGVSQSAQWGVSVASTFSCSNVNTFQPFNAAYRWFNTTDNVVINDPSITAMNVYLGSAYQQATSAVTMTSMSPIVMFG